MIGGPLLRAAIARSIFAWRTGQYASTRAVFDSLAPGQRPFFQTCSRFGDGRARMFAISVTRALDPDGYGFPAALSRAASWQSVKCANSKGNLPQVTISTILASLP